MTDLLELIDINLGFVCPFCLPVPAENALNLTFCFSYLFLVLYVCEYCFQFVVFCSFVLVFDSSFSLFSCFLPVSQSFCNLPFPSILASNLLLFSFSKFPPTSFKFSTLEGEIVILSTCLLNKILWLALDIVMLLQIQFIWLRVSLARLYLILLLLFIVVLYPR